MNVLIYGDNATINSYISSLKEIDLINDISVVSKEENKVYDNISYYSTIQQVKSNSNIDFIIICDRYSNVQDDWPELSSINTPIIWDSCFISQSLHLKEIRSNLEPNNLLFIGINELFNPQVADIHRNIERRFIGELGVANLKRYTQTSDDHDLELQSELVALYPYLSIVKRVFAMERKVDSKHYSTTTLRLENDAIINLEIFIGAQEYLRNGEYAGTRGVIKYSSESHTMKLKTASKQKSFTPTKLNDKKQMIAHFLQNINNQEMNNTWSIHERALQIKDAIKQSLETGAPVYIGGENYE
ncbi:hypothetical protein RZN22_07690 [Bacillaceae bacterium S4-13-58]